MESIIIIILGLLFSVLSKSAKDKKEIEKEREQRREQLSKTGSEIESRRKSKSLKEVLIEELGNMGEGEGSLGDILKKSFNGKEPSQQLQDRELETATNYVSENDNYKNEDYINDEEYYEALYSKVDGYMEGSTIADNIVAPKVASEEPITETKTGKKTIKGNRQYNPFSKSLNRKDVIRGIIFSEVLDKPKSLRNEKRSI